MMNESHSRQETSDLEAESVVTPEQIDRWSAEIQQFFAHTRQRLARLAHAEADVGAVNPLRQAAGPAPVVSRADSLPPSMPAASDHVHSHSVAGDQPTSSSSSDDALSRLHEIKQRLAARLQCP